MSCVWYNIHVKDMEEEYNYYLNVIKPIEKKYTSLCIIYKFIKIRCINRKISFYNSMLINYYNVLQKKNKLKFLNKKL